MNDCKESKVSAVVPHSSDKEPTLEERWQEFQDTFENLNEAFIKHIEKSLLSAASSAVGSGESSSSRNMFKFKRPTKRETSLASGELLADYKSLPDVQKLAFRTSPPVGNGCYNKIPKPRPGDWLSHHEERGQSFKSFARRSIRHGPHGHVDTLEIVPIGEFDPDEAPSIVVLQDFMNRFFGCKCRIAKDRISVKDVATSSLVDGDQLLCSDALSFLRKRRVHRSVFAQIGVTMQDLTPGEGWNFVYGQASLVDGVGIFSFARYNPNFFRHQHEPLTVSEHEDMLQKSCKTMAHEVTHVFGLRHCIYFHCIMNGNNGDEEHPLALCPICLRKLHDAVGPAHFKIQERYKSLAKFYNQRGWTDPLHFVTTRSSSLSMMLSGNTEQVHHDKCGCSAQAKSQSRTMRVKAKKGLIIRRGALKSSEKVTTLQFGDIVTVSNPPEMLRTSSGTVRIKLSCGWTTAVSKKTGQEMLEETKSCGGAEDVKA